MKKNITYTCPPEYRRNYKKEFIEKLQIVATSFAFVSVIMFMLVYFS